MKKIIVLIGLFAGGAVSWPVWGQGAPETIAGHYSVVKQTPEDPYNVRINIHLENKTAQTQAGTLHLTVEHPGGTPLKDTSFRVELTNKASAVFSCPVSFPFYGEYRVQYDYADPAGERLSDSFSWLTEPVNFFYAFGTPHRLTVAQPDNSSKTLLDVTDSSLTLSWTYEDLNYYPYSSFREIKADWHVVMQPRVDGTPFETSKWTRTHGYLPLLENRYESPDVSLLLEAVGADEATVVRVTVTNKSDRTHHVRLPWICPGNLKGHNPGWVDETLPTDHLLAGWNGPADQVLILGVGADDYPLDPVMVTQLNMDWTLQPHETRTGYLIRPYDKFARDLDQLRSVDWAARFEAGQETWETLLAKTGRIILPDSGVVKAYYAGLADIFIMREPVGRGYIATVPGTNGYRSGPNAFESAIATVALAQAGLYREAEIGYRVNWDLQTETGDWTEPGGWGHWMWAGTGYKAWAANEYFQHTRDTAFLEKRYRQMLAASRWQHRMRQRTRTMNPDGSRPLTYGLMPVGMGDGGLKNDGSYYGIYYTHNIWPVYADSLAYRAALTLGREDEARELKAIYDEAREDLLTAMQQGAVVEPDGTRWLSAVPGKTTSSSCWGLLAPAHTTGLLPADHELMTNTLGRYTALVDAYRCGALCPGYADHGAGRYAAPGSGDRPGLACQRAAHRRRGGLHSLRKRFLPDALRPKTLAADRRDHLPGAASSLRNRAARPVARRVETHPNHRRPAASGRFGHSLRLDPRNAAFRSDRKNEIGRYPEHARKRQSLLPLSCIRMTSAFDLDLAFLGGA